MKPDVVVDIGNSRMKWGRCSGGAVAEMESLPLDDPGAWSEQRQRWLLAAPARWALASVNPVTAGRFVEWSTETNPDDELLPLRSYRDIPLHFSVDAPEEVGTDRVLNTLAAHCFAHPHAAIVISVGTAVTVDLVDANGVFLGGVIFPGPRLMARSLHEHTAKLPLLEVEALPPVVAPGKNTGDAIRAGIRASIVGAAILLVNHYADLAEAPWVFITGGAAGDLERFQFGKRFRGTRYLPTLTLEGIRIAAEALP